MNMCNTFYKAVHLYDLFKRCELLVASWLMCELQLQCGDK